MLCSLGSLRPAGLALLAAALTQPPAAHMRVWAVGDSFRIDPTTGNAREANSLILPDAPRGDYHASNVVWDGQHRRISIKSARNETVAFQVIVERTDTAPLRRVNVTTGALTGPGGVTLGEASVSMFKEWYVNVDRRTSQDYTLGVGWYPDALIPTAHYTGRLFPKSYILPFDVPDLMNNIGHDQQNQALWFDVYVPRDRRQAPPGEYTSTITVSTPSGERVELTLSLAVWDFALPEETHVAGNIHNDTELNTFAPDLELKYYQMIRRHRLAMGVLGYAPDIAVNGSNIQFDWTSYDARLGKYLDGSAFTEKYGYSGPGYGVPIEMLVLPFDVYPVNVYHDTGSAGVPYGKEWKFYRPWPVDLPDSGFTPEYGEVWKKAFRAFEDHFDQHPSWNRTKPIVFLLSLDESYDEGSIQKFLYYGRLLKESGAKRLKFRIDGSYPMATMDRLADVVDILDPRRACLRAGTSAAAPEERGRRLVLRWHGHPGRRPARLSGARLGGVEVSGPLLDDLGVRLQRAARLDEPGDLHGGRDIWLGARRRRLQRPGYADLPRGDHGARRAGRERSAQAVAPREPGLRVLLAALP